MSQLIDPVVRSSSIFASAILAHLVIVIASLPKPVTPELYKVSMSA